MVDIDGSGDVDGEISRIPFDELVKAFPDVSRAFYSKAAVLTYDSVAHDVNVFANLEGSAQIEIRAGSSEEGGEGCEHRQEGGRLSSCEMLYAKLRIHADSVLH